MRVLCMVSAMGFCAGSGKDLIVLNPNAATADQRAWASHRLLWRILKNQAPSETTPWHAGPAIFLEKRRSTSFPHYDTLCSKALQLEDSIQPLPLPFWSKAACCPTGHLRHRRRPEGGIQTNRHTGRHTDTQTYVYTYIRISFLLTEIAVHIRPIQLVFQILLKFTWLC